MAWALGGPACLGACLGLRFGLESAGVVALALPGILAGVTALTAPALYIGAAYLGVAPAPGVVLESLARGLRDAGLVLLGLTPTLALLTATATSTATVVAVGYAVVLLAVILGLRLLYRRLFADAPAGLALTLYATWSLVAMGIGGPLLFSVLAAQGGVR